MSGLTDCAPLDEADQEVVDDGGVNAADEADDCVLVDVGNVGVNGHGMLR